MAAPSLASNAKPDTLFLSTDASGMEVDLSQFDIDLTDATTYWYESPSGRTNVTGPWEVSVTFEADENSTGGALITHRGALSAAIDWQMNYTTSGGGWRLAFYQESGTPFLFADIPGSAPGSLVSITVQWCTRTDVINDDLQHEIWIWRQDSDERVLYWVNGKAAPAGSGSHDFIIGADDTSGTNNYTDPITMARVGDAFHSTTEGAQDWRDEPSEPSVSADTRLELAAQEATDGLGNDAETAGPVYVSAAAALNQNEFRLMGHILNKVYLAGTPRAAWEPQENAEAPKIIVDGTDYESWNTTVDISPTQTATVLLPFCHYRSAPPNASHAFVRVLLSYVATNDMKLYCVNSTLRPNSQGLAQQAFVTDTISTSGSDQMIDLGLLPVVHPGEPLWWYLAFAWDDNPSDATITILSWNIISAYEEA